MKLNKQPVPTFIKENGLPDHDKRNKKIYTDRQSGKTYPALAAMYGIGRERVREIVIQQSFKDAHPEQAKTMEPRVRNAAAFLWSRGYVVTKKPPTK